ncbi:MAG: alpha/beta hydrolase, partial [Mesorhizobium sp.]
MIDRRSFIVAALAALLPLGVSAAGRPGQPEPQTLDYGPAKLDIYAPAGAKNLPVVF